MAHKDSIISTLRTLADSARLAEMAIHQGEPGAALEVLESTGEMLTDVREMIREPLPMAGDLFDGAKS